MIPEFRLAPCRLWNLLFSGDEKAGVFIELVHICCDFSRIYWIQGWNFCYLALRNLDSSFRSLNVWKVPRILVTCFGYSLKFGRLGKFFIGFAICKKGLLMKLISLFPIWRKGRYVPLLIVQVPIGARLDKE